MLRKHLLIMLCGLAGACSLLTSTASANLINVDFNGADKNSAVGTTATGKAAIGSSGDIWNGADHTSSSTALSLVDSTGASTGVSLTWSGGTSWLGNNGSGTSNAPNVNLMGDFLYSNSGSTTLSGVPAGTYDLYAYSENDNSNRPTTLTVGSTTLGATSDPSTSSWTNGANFVEFAGISPASDGSITLGFAGPNGGTLNGFQLVSVPEPASVGLLSIGVVGLLVRRRSRA